MSDRRQSFRPRSDKPALGTMSPSVKRKMPTAMSKLAALKS
jgi:hypothetical protein